MSDPPPQPTPLYQAPAPVPGPDIGERETRRLWDARIAFLIGVVSILSAVVAWQTSLAADDANARLVRAMQAQAEQLRREQAIEGTVDQDERLLGRLQEHRVAAKELQEASDAARATDPELADALEQESQAALSLARAIEPFFLGAGQFTYDEDGAPMYDPAYVAENLRQADSDLRELDPDRLFDVAHAADERELALLFVAVLLVGSLFFLTLAQLIARRIRFWFLGIGGSAALVGVMAFVLVEVLL